MAEETHQSLTSGVIKEGGGEDEFDYITADMDMLRISFETPARSKPDCSSDWAGEEKVAYRFKIVAAKGTSRVDGF